MPTRFSIEDYDLTTLEVIWIERGRRSERCRKRAGAAQISLSVAAKWKTSLVPGFQKSNLAQQLTQFPSAVRKSRAFDAGSIQHGHEQI